jgi:hypothetical protein
MHAWAGDGGGPTPPAGPCSRGRTAAAPRAPPRPAARRPPPDAAGGRAWWRGGGGDGGARAGATTPSWSGHSAACPPSAWPRVLESLSQAARRPRGACSAPSTPHRRAGRVRTAAAPTRPRRHRHAVAVVPSLDGREVQGRVEGGPRAEGGRRQRRARLDEERLWCTGERRGEAGRSPSGGAKGEASGAGWHDGAITLPYTARKSGASARMDYPPPGPPGHRRFGPLGAPRARTKTPYRLDLRLGSAEGA